MDRPEIKKTKSKTSISFYTLDNRVEDAVRCEIDSTLLSRPSIHKKRINETIYTCVKELMVNASSSNIKKIFFVEAKIDEKNNAVYEVAKKNVRKLMNEHYLSYMRSKLQKHNQNVEVHIEDKKDGIVVMVQNPAPLHEQEEMTIRETFRKAMSPETSDIALIYNGEGFDEDSPAFGLVMIINLLKDAGINPAYFRMGVVKNNTIARIEIPLTADYVGLRE